MRMVVLAILAALLGASSTRAAKPGDGTSAGWMVELTLDGRKIEGTPLAWDNDLVHLLGRDGRLWQFAPEKAVDFRKTSDRFRSLSISRGRGTLLRELGREYEVSGTGHYLIAHPRGHRDKWAERFEELYRSFVHYFSVRGFRPSKPPFPLIGIVCKDRREFYRYAAEHGASVSGGVLGYYFPSSNRIILYDMGIKEDSPYWQENAAVILHEATHQMAFNTGIHSRWTQPPVWVAEGLATMFEAPGVYDSRRHTRRSDRINREQLHAFRELVEPKHRVKLLTTLIASDNLFASRPGLAYAEAWAWTFYLMETRPRKYTQYLTLTAAHPPFTDYSASKRTADFTSVFGKDWEMLEAQFLRFMAGVK